MSTNNSNVSENSPSKTLDNSSSIPLNDHYSSPFYLHPSDNPRNILVSTLLDGDNYQTWSRAMQMALTTKNKLYIIYSDTAAAVWTDLGERFSQGNAAKVYRIRCDIISHLQEQLSIFAYYTKLKALWDELSSYLVLPPCSCGVIKALAEFQLQEKLMQFLMGLNNSFSAIRS
ncbi:uncharacterized protein LOC143888697 [Tasmannia lanceolata]|uniref:uncharacterized protein LOC143888697 n=1 Tax=Tasmannia lanceolata TaxID=3420 RepID=UPI0040628F45